MHQPMRMMASDWDEQSVALVKAYESEDGEVAGCQRRGAEVQGKRLISYVKPEEMVRRVSKVHEKALGLYDLTRRVIRERVRLTSIGISLFGELEGLG